MLNLIEQKMVANRDTSKVFNCRLLSLFLEIVSIERNNKSNKLVSQEYLKRY